jgi:hypothetical protein
MQISFIIGNEIKFTARLNISKQELLGSNNNINRYNDNMLGRKQKFKIPLNVKYRILIYKRNQLPQKNKNNIDDFDDDDEEESISSSDSFNEFDDDEIEEELDDNIGSERSEDNLSKNSENKKVLIFI